MRHSAVPLSSLADLLLLLVLPAQTQASVAAADVASRLSLRVSGARSSGGVHGEDRGWGGCVSLGYQLVERASLVAGVARTRVAREGSTFVSTITPWTVGIEIHPQRERLLDPFFRLGLGLYHVRNRGEYWNFMVRSLSPYTQEGNEAGLNVAGGVDAKVSSRVRLGLYGEGHQSFSREVGFDAPSLGEVRVLDFGARLVYAPK